MCLQCLIRRGGVREKAFQCPEGPFLLFPTGYHSTSELCKPGEARPYHNDDLMWDPKNSAQVPVKGYAVVCPTMLMFSSDSVAPGSAEHGCSGCHLCSGYAQHGHVTQVQDKFTTNDRNAFKRLDSLHIWTDEFLAKRLGQKDQPITALLLRVWLFDEPVTVAQRDDYWGCFSWGVSPTKVMCNTNASAVGMTPYQAHCCIMSRHSAKN